MKILRKILPLLMFLSFFTHHKSVLGSHSEVINNNFNSVYAAFEKNDYKASLDPLFTIFSQDTILPDEATFYLGVALSKMEKYEAGQNALLKYIRLTKDSGDFFMETVSQLIETNTVLGVLDKTDRMICDAIGPLEGVFEVCPKCHGNKLSDQECKQCKGSKHEVCSDCLGKGVVVRFSYYDDHSLCNKCEGKGYSECTRCEGTGQEFRYCSRCSGEGQIQKARECNFVNQKEKEADHTHEGKHTEGD